MSEPAFIHLRLHSEYSITDGVVRLDEVITAAQKDNMPALALTDLSNLFGMVKFYKEARAKGIKPIIGCDLWLTNKEDRDKPFRFLLLCQSRQGYLRLCDLISKAYRNNQHRGRPEIDEDWLDHDGATEGLLALSGGHEGDIGTALVQENLRQAKKLIEKWQRRFPGRFYLELQRFGLPIVELHVRRAITLASEVGIPVVATHPVQFLMPDDFKAHEARVCIAEGYTLADQRRPKSFTEQQYFKSQVEIAKLFSDIPEALANSVAIAQRCNFSIELGKNYLPLFPTPNNLTLDQYLCERAEAGLLERMQALFPDEKQRSEKLPIYQDRLKFETQTIIQMGYPGYFLIVADFINWAKQNNVPVGPGRGSGAGSLVAFSLGITDLDPLRYDLLFERFLNPERVSMPDFDIDFCQDGRERVIDYVKEKYGKESVSQIVTFGTMAAKAVVRDVGRVLDLPYNFVDQLAKLIPFEIGMTLKKARQVEPLLNERAEKEEEVKELLELAGRLEGLARNVGMHAGGVLIAPGKLTDFCPLYAAPGSDSVVSQFDKDDVEQAGLVKFDFLGLRTLTILDWAVRFINNLKQKLSTEDTSTFCLEAIPLDDVATYSLLKIGNTTAVFQLESRGLKDLMRRLQPDCFEEIIALVALYRPGPLNSGMVDDFINRKHGKAKADYMHPKLEPALKPTYGVIVYQEQVMQIAQELAGYSLASADLLRRAMGKKKPEEMAKHRSIFVEGAVARQVAPKQAEHLFDLMEKFAEYGFNKSHSAAYALVAYQTAYLKAHYPAAFMAATLSADMDDTDKVRIFYEDSVLNGVEILPPDINSSEYRFVPINEKQVRYGLGAVKGTGESAINTIIKIREKDGNFIDLFDFCNRIDRRVVNRRVIESLIRAGAFDSLNNHRATLLASVGIAIESAEQQSRDINQNSLFGFTDESTQQQKVKLLEMEKWSEREQLVQEKTSLGFYLSGHPFHTYKKELQGFVKGNLKNVTAQRESILLAGIILSVRTQMTRRGKMAFVTLDDDTAQVDVSIFNELFEANRSWLKEDQLLIIEGKASHDEYSGGMRVVADKLYDLVAARGRFAKAMKIKCNGQANAAKLMELLTPYCSGTCPVSIEYHNKEALCELRLGDAWRVNLRDELIVSLNSWFKEDNVQIIYQS